MNGNPMKSIIFLGVMLLLMFFVAACEGDDSTPVTTTDTTDTTPAPTALGVPTLVMDLPDSLTSAATAPAALTNGAHGEPHCDFGSEGDPFGNGYRMTKFLVNISQSQNCLVDFIIGEVVAFATPFIGEGPIAIGDGTGGEPTHLQVEQSADELTFQVWLFFAGLTADPGFYLTWSNLADGGVSGQMIMMSTDTSQGGPEAIRADFSRGASTDDNEVFMRFPSTNTDAIEGFRVQVTRTGTGTSKLFEAKGRMSMTGQFGGNSLPVAETFATPSFSMVAVSDEAGLGAAVAVFENVALHLENVDTDLSDGDQSFNLGSYQFTLADKAYFDALGNEEWLEKGTITAATYVNTSGANVRSGWGVDTAFPGGVFFTDCFESVAGCDFDTPPPEIPGLNLPTGYFSTTCVDTLADPPTADCALFISALFQFDVFGLAPINSAGLEPDGDFRQAALNAAVQFTSVWPTGEDATTTFAIPAAP